MKEISIAKHKARCGRSGGGGEKATLSRERKGWAHGGGGAIPHSDQRVLPGPQKGFMELSIKLETYLGYGKGEKTDTKGWVEVGVKKKAFCSGSKDSFSSLKIKCALAAPRGAPADRALCIAKIGNRAISPRRLRRLSFADVSSA
jgi:hypothetical protein